MKPSEPNSVGHFNLRYQRQVVGSSEWRDPGSLRRAENFPFYRFRRHINQYNFSECIEVMAKPFVFVGKNVSQALTLSIKVRAMRRRMAVFTGRILSKSKNAPIGW